MMDRLDTRGDEPTRMDDGGSPERQIPTPFITDGGHETFVGAPDSLVEFQIGQVLAGQFEIVRALGQGGMGAVYEVADRLTRQRLALKVILPSILSNPKAVERFVQEVNTCRQLRHPGIVAVYDVRQDGPLLFFTMEYLEGKTVRQVLNTKGPLPLEEVADILRPLCYALEYAHRHTVHRDISPENIMVLNDGSVKLLDFGIAKAVDPSAASTGTRQGIGKAYYIAPEQRKDAASVDHRADIYSLGVTFFELLTGEMPMGYNQVTALRPELPSECDDLFADSVTAVEMRYGSATKFRDALDVCIAALHLKQAKTLAELARDRLSDQERQYAARHVQAGHEAMGAAARSDKSQEESIRQYEAAQGHFEEALTAARGTLDTLKIAAETAHEAARTSRDKQGLDEHRFALDEVQEGERLWEQAEKEAGDHGKRRELYDRARERFDTAAKEAPRRQQQAKMDHARLKAEATVMLERVKEVRTRIGRKELRHAGDLVEEAEAIWPQVKAAGDDYTKVLDLLKCMKTNYDKAIRTVARRHQMRKALRTGRIVGPVLLVVVIVAIAGVALKRSFSGVGDTVSSLFSIGQTSNLPRPGLGRTFADIEMCWIPPGQFMMGSKLTPEQTAVKLTGNPTNKVHHVDEVPRHLVTLSKGFWFGKFEVTKRQWAAVMDTNPWEGKPKVNDNPDSPALYIDWDKAQEFAQKLSARREGEFRLPTEAEWEYACRAGTTTSFAWGDNPENGEGWGNMRDRDKMGRSGACNWDDGYANEAPVGSYRPNKWGLYDITGNVWEWCQDWKGQYPSEAVTDPSGPASGPFRIFRGAGHASSLNSCLCANRPFEAGPENKGTNNLGLRVVREFYLSDADVPPDALPPAQPTSVAKPELSKNHAAKTELPLRRARLHRSEATSSCRLMAKATGFASPTRPT
jgi:formylglycine-generating enzyme required for sulfatase activity